MRVLLFVTALLSAIALAPVAMACTAIEHVTESKAEFTLKADDCLWSSDDRYMLYMHKEGTLTLTDKRYPGHAPIWAADTGGTAVPGSTAILKNDGSFVVADPSGKALWKAPVHGSGAAPAAYFIMIAKARVEIYKGTTLSDPNRALVWASEASDQPDKNGECQCHITNTDGSPGKASGEAFGICGLMACRSTCAAKKDYFGDALIGTYNLGAGKCKAF